MEEQPGLLQEAQNAIGIRVRCLPCHPSAVRPAGTPSREKQDQQMQNESNWQMTKFVSKARNGQSL